MAKMNGRTRRILYNIIAKRDGDFCRMCHAPASERQLVIDHIDNNNANNQLSNLQLLCRSCNYRKNPRPPVATSVRSESETILRLNQSKEPEFRKYVYEELIRDERRFSFKALVNAGAEKIGISPVTAKRYLDKMCSDNGALEVWSSGVKFKEKGTVVEILPESEIDIINSIIFKVNPNAVRG
jgi:hypothetical protein